MESEWVWLSTGQTFFCYCFNIFGVFASLNLAHILYFCVSVMSDEYEIRLFISKPLFLKHRCHWSILWGADGDVNYHEMYAVAQNLLVLETTELFLSRVTVLFSVTSQACDLFLKLCSCILKTQLKRVKREGATVLYMRQIGGIFFSNLTDMTREFLRAFLPHSPNCASGIYFMQYCLSLIGYWCFVRQKIL